MAGYLCIGMHYSGTSLIAEILIAANCAASPGDHTELLRLNDDLLATEGATWQEPAPALGGVFDRIDRNIFRQRTAALLPSSDASTGPWTMPDPRFAFTLPLWNTVVEDLHAVLCVRDPAMVAQSLHVRDGIALPKALALWEAYNVSALRHSAGRPLTIANHADLLRTPLASTAALVTKLGDPLLRLPSTETLDALVEPCRSDISHHDLADVPVTNHQRDLYAALTGDADLEAIRSSALCNVSPEALSHLRDSPKKQIALNPLPITEQQSVAEQSRLKNPKTKRTAVVVLGCRLQPFAPTLATIRTTWGSEHHDDVDVFYCYGNACNDHELSEAGVPTDWVPEDQVREHHDLLLVGAADLVSHQSDAILRKRLLSLDYLLAEHQHDAYLLVCASSYIDQVELSEFVQDADLTMGFYGSPGLTEDNKPFLSGSAMMLSRDLAETLVHNRDEVIAMGGYQYADDVTIASWIAENISKARPDEIADSLFNDGPAISDNTFQRFPVSFQDFIAVPADRHEPTAGCFHYHFHTNRPEEMEAFHRRRHRNAQASDDASTTIFVQIASYRDRELPRTIRSALDQAAYPERLRFGICWQFDDRTCFDLDAYLTDERFGIERVHFSNSHGCTWARSQANNHYAEEPYYLQIDAHTRFVAGWDTTLIDMLEGIDAELPIISVYPPQYLTDGEGNDELLDNSTTTVLSLDKISTDLHTTQTTRPADLQGQTGSSPLLAAGFLFTRGSFCRDVPYDPKGYFAGEEVALAARAFTSGYDFFHPSEHVVWHRYDHGEPLHWTDHGKDLETTQEQSNHRLRSLLLDDGSELGEFGLGTKRPIGEFEDLAGIDFARAAAGTAIRFETPKPLRFTLDLDTSMIEQREDYDLWVFALLDHDQNELVRNDITDPDVLSFSTTTVLVDHLFEAIPTFYLLWPRSPGGFGTRVVQPLTIPIEVSESHAH